MANTRRFKRNQKASMEMTLLSYKKEPRNQKGNFAGKTRKRSEQSKQEENPKIRCLPHSRRDEGRNVGRGRFERAACLLEGPVRAKRSRDSSRRAIAARIAGNITGSKHSPRKQRRIWRRR